MASSAETPVVVSAEQLAEADAKFKKALKLRDSDLETAVELLGQVLETRNKSYGENALECADTYLYYGQCLFEQAQAASDFFGDQMKSAANQRAKAIAAAEAEAADDAEDADAEADKDEAAPSADAEEDKQTSPIEAEPSEPAAADAAKETAIAEGAPADADNPQEPSTPATDEAAKQPEPTPAAQEDTAATEAGSSKAAEEQAAASTEATKADAGAEAAEAPAAAADGGEESGDDDESDSSGEDEGEEAAGEEAAGEGEAAAAPEVTGESDDMALAWEMLELARLIYNNNGGAATHADKLADCHMYIGDILAEQEKFEAAVEEYKSAQEMLAQVEGGHNAHRRRAAELEFKKATALQLLDSPADALTAMQAAKAHLSTHLLAVNAEIAKAGSSGADVTGAVASAAFASILSGYGSTPAAGSSGTEQQKDEGAAAAAADTSKVAKLHKNAADLKGAIDSINDRIEELSAAVQEHVSMKEQLANLFKSVAAEGPAAAEEQQQAGAGSSGGAVESIGFGQVGSSKGPGGDVKDIGVIGKGRRVAPTPSEPPAAAAPDAAAPAAEQPPAAEQEGSAEASKAPADQAAAPAAADGDALAGKKRPLSDLTSSDQEQAGEGTTGAADGGAAAKAAAAAAAQAADQPDAVPKRTRV